VSRKKCPVCKGKGYKPAGFYDGDGDPEGDPVTCRSCGGTGHVDNVEEAAVGARDPHDLTYDGEA